MHSKYVEAKKKKTLFLPFSTWGLTNIYFTLVAIVIRIHDFHFFRAFFFTANKKKRRLSIFVILVVLPLPSIFPSIKYSAAPCKSNSGTLSSIVIRKMSMRRITEIFYVFQPSSNNRENVNFKYVFFFSPFFFFTISTSSWSCPSYNVHAYCIANEIALSSSLRYSIQTRILPNFTPAFNSNYNTWAGRRKWQCYCQRMFDGYWRYQLLLTGQWFTHKEGGKYEK